MKIEEVLMFLQAFHIQINVNKRRLDLLNCIICGKYLKLKIQNGKNGLKNGKTRQLVG